ncbi:MAG TPA: SET domain-containing protein-lysine N-methyltransferase [Candidatus Paceibacterota bacterium]|nr:SET domain-containing protein-lysine N-methyltransferase [Candidatus Paceibacterota bacterium]
MKRKSRSKFIPVGVKLRVGRSRAGLGLFTLEDIKKGACVIEYTGKVLTKQQEEDSNSLYLFEVTKKKTIDGAARSNTARYINHSCRPNCEIDIHKGRVWVMAKRKIIAGEELSYDYDTEYFEAYIKPKGCRCIKCMPA